MPSSSTTERNRRALEQSREHFRAQIAELRRLAGQAATDEEARMLISRIAQISRRYRIMHGVDMAESPLAQAVELDPGYRTPEHLLHLSDRIADAVRDVEHGQNRMLAVSMPPRAGKSQLVSRNSPIWMLRRHPDWKIMLASYDSSLTTAWTRGIRETVEERPGLGIALKADGGAGGVWETVEGGGMFATSVGGNLTGRGARVLIIDDPIKDFVEAHSPNKREALWNWWLSVAQTRLEPPYLVLVVMCMTGDTPVLRPDGTETPLRDIRPGDEIATYEDGRLTTSRVLNWANQGPDDVFAVRLESGRVVRANARHPFLTVDENGAETWVRTDELREGSRILTAAGASGEASSAVPKGANARSAVEGYARRTTTRPAGRRATVLRPPTPTLDELRGSSTVTASRPRSMTIWSPSSEDSARSAESSRQRDRRTGAGSSASTTTTSPGGSVDFSATTATSSSSSTSRPTVSEPPLSTWSVTPDRVVSVEPAGREDVFDLQVERTENFIANGLVSHNTRWHEDDFVGRLVSREHEGNPLDWERIVLPAIAGPGDPIGREEGDPLFSPIVKETREQAIERWADVKRSVGTYTFSAMYQQSPAPAKGAIFDSTWWRYWTTDPSRVTDDGRVVYLDPDRDLDRARWVDSWDMAFKGTDASDYVVAQRWARSGGNRYLLAQQRGRWSFTETVERMKLWTGPESSANPWGDRVHERLVEDKANGTAVMDTLKDRVSGIKAVSPKDGKEARARAVTPEVESGSVYLPHPSDPGNEWVTDLLSELRNFPHDAHDDQVDTLTQALMNLREGRGMMTVPGRGAQVPRNIGQTALAQYRRPRGLGGR